MVGNDLPESILKCSKWPLIGSSFAMCRTRSLVEKVAPTSSTVLICGESGTGKELVARALHELSDRSQKPFIAVNCAAMPASLIEAELFGYSKGAFTGAIQKSAGRFLEAESGTLFLDEIGELPLDLQAKLLRVIQDRMIQPLGTSKKINVNIRIIAATNQSLERMVAQRIFREDLYFRLNVIPIKISPLRDRREDLAELSSSFLEKFNSRYKKKVYISKDCFHRFFLNYDWPGNVRELENLIERLVVLKTEGEIRYLDLPEDLIEKINLRLLPAQESFQFSASGANGVEKVDIDSHMQILLGQEGFDLRHAVENLEKKLILVALQKCGGNKNKAAQFLKMNRTTLIEKIRKYHRDLILNSDSKIPLQKGDPSLKLSLFESGHHQGSCE